MRPMRPRKNGTAFISLSFAGEEARTRVTAGEDFLLVNWSTPKSDVRTLLQSRQNRVLKPVSAHVQRQVIDANLTAIPVAELVSAGAG